MITAIAIRNMVCHHCMAAVRRCFEQAGISVMSISLGEVTVNASTLTPEGLCALDKALIAEGFERLENSEDALVERIKAAVIHHVRQEDECRLNMSACLERHLAMPYESLSRAFTAREGRTIEKYHIAQRVEWVKELMSYKELTLGEIAFRTGYSSTTHLSRQFKAVTGLTPSQYMQLPPSRKSLCQV